MEKNYLKEVSQIILEQLKVKTTELWAWGAKDFVYLERTVDKMKCPALMFSIRTPKVLRGGKVIISLNEGADEYIVEAVRVRNGIETLIGKETNVYCDELHDRINSLIEDKETFCNAFF